MTVNEMARMGGGARAKAHSKAELRKWGKLGGRPEKLDPEGVGGAEKAGNRHDSG